MVLNDIINQAAAVRAESIEVERRRSSRKISAYLNSEDEDDGPRIKERLAAACYRFIDIFCVWDCCYAYIRLAEVSVRAVLQRNVLGGLRTTGDMTTRLAHFQSETVFHFVASH
jgi:hypothetical protein